MAELNGEVLKISNGFLISNHRSKKPPAGYTPSLRAPASQPRPWFRATHCPALLSRPPGAPYCPLPTPSPTHTPPITHEHRSHDPVPILRAKGRRRIGLPASTCKSGIPHELQRIRHPQKGAKCKPHHLVYNKNHNAPGTPAPSNRYQPSRQRAGNKASLPSHYTTLHYINCS